MIQQVPSIGALPGHGFPGPSAPRTGSVLATDDDFDLDEHLDWLIREIDEGRQRVPPEPAVEGPAVSVSLGDAIDVDPALLAAMCGPDGLGGQAVSVPFGQDQAADTLRPGAVLAALNAQAVAERDSLTDDQLIGALRAALRLANHAAWQQTVVIAEFARRRQAQFEDAKARGVPVGCRAGEYPGEELAIELVETGACVGARIDAAADLTTRLPRTLAGMADGTIDLTRAATIAAYTRGLTDANAAYADEVLAAAAPGKRPDQLARKAAALEMKLAPEAVAARKAHARDTAQRVEARREDSGNASLSGRELDTADVIASKAHIDAIAMRLRDSGLVEGTLGRLRALALIDLTQGRDPLDRIKLQPAADPAVVGQWRPGGPRHPASAPSGPGQAPSEPGEPQRGQHDPASRVSPDTAPAPLPALINLLVPAGTLLGWGTAPAEAAGWGLLDADETRALLAAATRHPRTRWCMTIVAPDGTALAHGCAAGRHSWPGNDQPDPRTPPGSHLRPDPQPRNAVHAGVRAGAVVAPAATGPPQSARLLDLLRRLNITLEPVARDACAHVHAEERYVPSRKLRHLIRARTQTCTAPGCDAQAVYCDFDHTVPYPDGPTCECNLTPKCRRHHRTKQAPGWQVTQPTPDTTVWTTPSGRSHTSAPQSMNRKPVPPRSCDP